jgi:tetratricopeptide (TPR) repeat protein
MLAEANRKRKKYARAKKYYGRVLAADPEDEYIHIQLAEYWKAVGKPAEAAQELSLAFANERLDCRTKVQLLTSFYTAEEFYGERSKAAFGLLDKVMATCGDSTEYALLYGDVLMRQRKYAEAARWLELSLKKDSSRYEVWEGLLICLTEVPEREDDMAALSARASRLFPMHTLPLYLQALYEVKHERYAEALPHLEKFSYIGTFSGALFGMDVHTLANGVFNDAERFNSQVHYLFMGCGTEENFGTQVMVKELQTMGIKANLFESQGTAHEWLTWRRCLKEFLPHLFK